LKIDIDVQDFTIKVVNKIECAEPAPALIDALRDFQRLRMAIGQSFFPFSPYI